MPDTARFTAATATAVAFTALSAVTAAAQTASAEAARPTVLDAISVSAERTAQPLADLPATVSVIDATALERRNLQSLRDIGLLEPGVSVGTQPARAGTKSWVIRGIGENRVRVQIDNVRVPEFPGSNIGAGTYNRDFVDLEAIKRIEILRGPASALYGSDAIGGVVSYVTKDPADLMATVGKNWYVAGKVAYDGADSSLSETATGAARVGPVEMMLVVTRRDGHEYEPKGNVTPNPVDFGTTNLLGKIVYAATAADTFTLTTEYLDKRAKTDLLSEHTATVQDSVGADRSQRWRVSLEHVHDAPIGFVDRLEWRVYYTSVDRSEDTYQLRAATDGLRERFSKFLFNQEILGAQLQMESRFATGGLKHTLTYGLGIDHTETSRPRDRYEVSLATGAISRSFSGGPGVPLEVFPNKNFPDTTSLQAGAYVQDRIEIGRLTLIPGLRVDHYKLDPNPDQSFRNTNLQNFEVQEYSDTAVSPKLGATFKLDRQHSLFGQYARGFRAPPYDDANIGFTNGPSRYEILPNADLKAEKSDGFELGVRGRYAGGSSFQVSGFYNIYTDFIEQQVVGMRDGITQFQARNIDRATIWGFEAKGELHLTDAWAVRGSAAYAHGENDDTGRPLDSVDPLTLQAGLRYDPPGDGLSGELLVSHVFKKDRVSDDTYFQAPSYTLVDLVAGYDIDPGFTLNVGIFNLFDQQYFPSQNVVGIAANRTDRDRFAAAGRTVGANLTLRW